MCLSFKTISGLQKSDPFRMESAGFKFSSRSPKTFQACKFNGRAFPLIDMVDLVMKNKVIETKNPFKT